MTDLYSEWRDFYAKRVSSWMSLEELRAECGKLTTTDGTSPELLLIHAMHALEECVRRNEAPEALEYYRSGEDYQPTPASEAITALHARLREKA